jgi:cobalt/nickel transport system permease protein
VHISEGVLSPAILGLGAALAVCGTAIGLRRLDYDRLMTVAILAAAFFVGSLIHIPIGPSSAHLILNGLLGVILGWAAFPAILVALMLQSVLFQYGGFTVLGVNTFNMAFPAVLCFILLLRRAGRGRGRSAHGRLPGLHGRRLSPGRAASFPGPHSGHDRGGNRDHAGRILFVQGPARNPLFRPKP